MQTRRITKAAKRYWKLLLILAILLQLSLMIKDVIRSPQVDKEPQKIVIFQQSAPPSSDANGDPSSACPKISFEACPNTIFLQSGYKMRSLPIMCLNSVDLFNRTNFDVEKGKSESQRGVHAVLLTHGTTVQVVQKRVFDTYSKDVEFVDFLISTARQGDILLLASFDDMSVNLSPTARGILTQYFGSQEADTLKMRDYYVFIGQKGLTKGYAFEQLVRKRTGEDFPAESAKLAICAKFPLGPLGQLPPESVLRSVNKQSHLGIMFNCGLDITCEPLYSIPVWISTGTDNVAGPELCINSHLVFHPLVKMGGSGYNLAQYDPTTQQIVTRDRFNVAGESHSRLEIFLEQIPEDHLLFGVIHDDGSRRAPNLTFTNFGVTIVEALRFRSIGFFIAQRNAERAIQSIGHRADGADFAATITFRGCIPRQIKGIHYSRGAIIESNIEHRFCGVNGINYDPVCAQAKSASNDRWLPAQAAPTSEMKTLKIPVFVMAGNDAASLQRCLESLANQALVSFNPQVVKVFASQHSIEYDDMKKYTGAYGYKFETCNSGADCETYQRLYAYVLQKAAAEDEGNSFIFLEPDVVLSPDFLAIVSAIFSGPVSPEIAGVSGWNHNGYSNLVEDPEGVFLTEAALPSPCLILSRPFSRNVLMPYLTSKANSPMPRFLPWFEDTTDQNYYFAVLEVSRCFKVAPHMAAATVDGDGKALFDLFYHQPRRASLSVPETVDNVVSNSVKVQSHNAYDSYLLSRIRAPTSKISDGLCDVCDGSNGNADEIDDSSRKTETVLIDDWSQLEEIADCCKANALVTNLRSTKKDSVKQPGFGLYKLSYMMRTPFIDYLIINKRSPIYYTAFRENSNNQSAPVA